MTQKEALLYAKMPEHNTLVNKTKGFIRWALERVENPYVACSFGKDSAVMLHLVLEQKPDIPVVWVTFEETRMISNYQDVVNDWINLFKINLNEIFVETEIDAEFDDQIAMYKSGFKNAFVGIRMQEHKNRKVAIKKYGKFYDNGSKIRIAPLAEWTLKDIAAYNLCNNLPMLDFYKLGFDIRTTTGIPSQGVRSRMLNQLKQIDISRFNQLLLKYPQLAKYV